MLADTCPICGARLTGAATEAPPFCTERCRLLDLGNWLGDRYRIPDPGEAPDEDTEDLTHDVPTR